VSEISDSILRTYPGYLFDLDGTLIDTAPDINAALNYALKAAGYDAVEEALTRHWVGHGARACIEQALAHKKVPRRILDAMLADFLVRYREHIAVASQPYPGVVETLHALRERGAVLGVVTNKHGDLTIPLLDELGMLDTFSTVICGDSAGKPKPAADPVLMACGELRLEPARVLFVGDSQTDVLAARAARCPVVCVPYGYNHGVPPDQLGADALIESFADLV
jgi:phosphoglycolate phosphatase